MKNVKRTWILRAGWGVAMMALIARLFVMQVLEHEQWVEAAEKQHVMQNIIVAERGKIYMQDEGKPVPVVMNQGVWTLIVDPQVADAEKTKELLTKVAKDYIIADWREVFADKNRRYFVVAKNVPLKVVRAIKEAGLAGIWTRGTTKRAYPEGELASGLLGFVNTDGTGQYGVEGSLNKELAGKNGLLKTVKDVNNIPLTIGKENIRVPAEDGKNLLLTVDRNVQLNVEKALARGLKRSAAEKASAIVMKPATGEIMAMANLPNYNPEKYGDVKGAEAYVNRVLDEPYEPASVCKAFAFAAAINEGVLTPETTYENRGMVVIDGWPIHNAYEGMLGTITMQDALNYSLNTGSIEALKRLGGGEINARGRAKLYDYYTNKFRLGRETGVDMVEALGMVREPEGGYGLDSTYANMTFGQNLNLTMIQVATGFSALINGGEYVKPYIVAGEVQEKGGQPLIIADNDKKVNRERIIKEETSRTMRQMLYTTRRGRRMAGIDREGFYVGGKTGTAQVIRDGKYVMDETIATYVGFGGRGENAYTIGANRNILNNERQADGLPEYLIMVRIEAKGKRLGGEVDALPIFDEISNYMQDYMRIRPYHE